MHGRRELGASHGKARVYYKGKYSENLYDNHTYIHSYNIHMVAQIVDGGFAHSSGLKVGDVLVSIPGIFGDDTNVVGMGIEQV